MTALGSVPLATGTTANSITFAWTSPALRDFCARFGIRHVLCAAAPDALSGLEHRFCFCCCRGPGKRAFSDPEHRLIRFLAPHLIEARRANLVAYFAACRDEAFRSGLCDRMGLIHHAEPGFPELLRREWPQLRTAHVPASLLAALPGHDAVFEGAAIVIKAKHLGDLVHLQAGRQGRLRRLSPRERLITKPLVCGATYKEIRQTLGIAASTVTKHANSIYRKTGVRNKTQLAEFLKERNNSRSR